MNSKEKAKAEMEEETLVLAQMDHKYHMEGIRDQKGVKNLLVYYARHSTMHGIPSIVGSRLYKGRSLFWCFVVLLMGVLLVSVIYCQMSDFYNYPTVTSVNVAYVNEEDFPAITICDLNVFNKDFIKRLDERTQKFMPYLTEISGIFHLVGKKILDKLVKIENAPQTNKSAEYLVETLLGNVNTMIHGTGLRCAYGDYYWEDCSVAMETRVTEMGVCFSIDTRKLARAKEGRKLNAVGNALRGLNALVTTGRGEVPFRLFQFDGFKIVLHDHDEVPLPLSKGFVVGANCSTEIQISKSVRIGLSPPFKAFGGTKCVDTTSKYYQGLLKRFPYYTKEACEKECFFDYVIQVCGCRHFLHPGNESLCTLEVLADCYRRAEAQYYSGQNGTSKKECDCPLPCRESHYQASVTCAKFAATEFFQRSTGDLDANVVTLHFFFPDPVVTTIRQVPIYSLQGLLGSIGGQVGLFMGFSLITVAEMFELIFLLCTRRNYQQPPELSPR